MSPSEFAPWINWDGNLSHPEAHKGKIISRTEAAEDRTIRQGLEAIMNLREE